MDSTSNTEWREDRENKPIGIRHIHEEPAPGQGSAGTLPAGLPRDKELEQARPPSQESHKFPPHSSEQCLDLHQHLS